MDACVRCLREGRVGEQVGAALIVDSMEPLGGAAVFTKVLDELVVAVNAGRSQAQHVHVVAVDVPPSELRARGVHSITDCFSDPCGWLTESSCDPHQMQWTDLQVLRQLALSDAASWLAAMGSSEPNSCSVVIAGLSTLLLRHPSMQVIQVLHSLVRRPQVSSLLLSVNVDLHPPQVVSALQEMCSTTLQLQALPGLQQQLVMTATGKVCHGQLTSTSKRLRLGRLQVQQQLYALLLDGGVEVLPPPAGVTLDARTLVQTSLLRKQQLPAAAGQGQSPAGAGLPAPTVTTAAVGGQPSATASTGGGQQSAASTEVAGGAAEGLAKRLSSSMRLEVSDQERAAKAAVQLPYQHQGAGKTGQSADARDYLPPAAGGFGPGADDQSGSGRLGHILYVRDSEEEHDSDEDPDDDLDWV